MTHLKRELFIILASLGGLVIIWVFLYSPKLKDLNTSKGVLAKLQQDIDNSISAVEKIPLLKKQIEKLNSDIERLQLKQRLEEPKTESDIVETLAGSIYENIELISIQPIDAAEKWFGFDIGLKAKAFADLGEYIKSLNSAPLVLKIRNMVIRKPEGDDFSEELEIDLTIDAYEGSL